MVDIIKDKQQGDLLHAEIKRLETELSVAADNIDYYKTLLKETRSSMLKIHNIIGAISNLPDEETPDQAWQRFVNEITDKLEGDYK